MKTMRTGLQDALVALAADRRLRERFLRDRDEALHDFALEPRERAALSLMPADALCRFAASLVAKRWNEVRRVIPLSLNVCPSLERRYRDWLALHPAPAADCVLSPGLAEALRALPALTAELTRDTGETEYAAHLLAWEVLAGCSRVDGLARKLRSRFAVHAIAESLRARLVPIDPEPAPTIYQFTRTGVRWHTA